MALLTWAREKLINSRISITVAVLVCFFGSGSWLAINGIWVELSLLVEKSPQQWTLPSYLTVAIALANIGPVLYALGNRFVRLQGRKILTEIPVTYGIILLGIVSLLILAFTWDFTTTIHGKRYSTALISLTFLLAIVNCTSSVTFLPYMVKLKSEYMGIFFVGQGLSGLVPSLLAFGQGNSEENYVCSLLNVTVRHNSTLNISDTGVYYAKSNISYAANVDYKVVPVYFVTMQRFSVTIFFLILALLSCGCLFAFICLNHLQLALRERANKYKGNASDVPRENMEKHIQHLLHGAGVHRDQNSVIDDNPEVVELAIQKSMNSRSSLLSEDVYEDCVVEAVAGKHFRMRAICFLLVINGVMNFLSNGVLPSIQSYACLPYGNRVYHLTLTLSAIANPVSCFIFFIVPADSVKKISALLLLYLVSTSYTIYLASASPCPVLSNSYIGGVLVILITVIGVALVSYLKTAVSSLLRDQGRTSLVWCGISTQLGSCLGAILMFPIVNVYNVFRQTSPCSKCL